MSDWLADASPIELALAAFGLFAGTTVISLAVGFALERALRSRRIWDLPLDAGQLRLELIGNVVFVVVQVAVMALVVASGLPRYAEPSWPVGIATFLALMLGFQVFYYCVHRAMHHHALVRFHRWHHKSRVTTPLSAQSTSFVESLLWSTGYALIPALASQLAPISAEGWAAYLAFNVFGNILGHANVELVPATPATRTSALFSGVLVYHALHHARWTGHYSFQAALMDRLFGTEWKDWPALHREVAAGRPLKSLRETRD